MNNIGIILASGSGSRFGGQQAKQFVPLAGKMLIEYSLDAFNRHPAINEILLVTTTEQIPFIQELVIDKNYSKVSQVLTGGATRQASSAAGIAAVTDDNANVLIHDAARPLINTDIINRCITALEEHQAVNTAAAVTDTVITISSDNFISGLPPRSELRLSQTPQAFKAGIVRQAHAIALKNQQEYTDDCGLVLASGLSKVFVVDGSPDNIKITYPSDLLLAEQLLARKTI